MTLTADLTDVEAWAAGDILPPGTHQVIVIAAEEGKSSAGNPQLEVEMQATAGEHQGGTIRDWIHFTPKTAGKVKQVLEAFGMASDGSISVEASAFINKRAQILVREELYNGETKTKVKAYSPASGEAPAATSNGQSAKSDNDGLPF